MSDWHVDPEHQMSQERFDELQRGPIEAREQAAQRERERQEESVPT